MANVVLRPTATFDWTTFLGAFFRTPTMEARTLGLDFYVHIEI